MKQSSLPCCNQNRTFVLIAWRVVAYRDKEEDICRQTSKEFSLSTANLQLGVENKLGFPQSSHDQKIGGGDSQVQLGSPHFSNNLLWSWIVWTPITLSRCEI